MQLIVVEHACRGLTSEWLVRPVGPQDSGRTQAHMMVWVLADARWKTLDHRSQQAGLETEIHTADRHRPNSSPQPRPRTPAVLRRTVGRLPSGVLLRATTAGRKRALGRVARPGMSQPRSGPLGSSSSPSSGLPSAKGSDDREPSRLDFPGKSNGSHHLLRNVG
ncbi:MAG: hypothetical protein JO161_01595 [Planctomycetaceae bacterium]|nr:hypothetical protein [Planctomycetaceae bacterium]